MGRDESQSYAGFVPEPSAMATDTRAANKGTDNGAGIVHQTPRMKPEEAEADRREQEKAKLGSKRPQRGARNEFVSYLQDTRIVRGRNDDPLKGPPKEDSYAVYTPDQTKESYPNRAHETRNDMSKSAEKTSAGAKKVGGRRGIEEDGDDAAALPAMRARDRVQAESPVGSGGRAPIAPLRNVTVGAVAVEGAGGTSLDRIERGEGYAAGAGIRSEPSLISAELVTGENAMDRDEIREMLRSELQAELRNNIVQAEVLPPTETAAALARPSSQEAPSQPPAKPFWTRRKLCIAALAGLLLIAGGAAAAALLTNGKNNRGGAANANNVGATAQPQSPTVAPTISPAVGPPTPSPTKQPTVVTTTSDPTLQPSATTITSLPTTPAPTPQATTSPPTTAAPTPDTPRYVVSTANRCGKSELDARGNCGNECSGAADCKSGEYCWPVHANYCGSKTVQVCNDLTQATAGYRCGATELEARELCGAPCSHSINCGNGEYCQGAQMNTCDCNSGSRKLQGGNK